MTRGGAILFGDGDSVFTIHANKTIFAKGSWIGSKPSGPVSMARVLGPLWVNRPAGGQG